MELYNYKAELVRVIDGDTVRLKVDAGFNIYFEENFRLAEINAPSLKGDERADGLTSKAWLESFLVGKTLTINSEKHGKYRWLAKLYADGVYVNKKLVETGNAATYSK